MTTTHRQDLLNWYRDHGAPAAPAGSGLDEAAVQALIDAGIEAIPPAGGGPGLGAEVRKEGGQSANATNEWGILTFPVEVFDDADFWDSVNNRFVIPSGKGGLYFVRFNPRVYTTESWQSFSFGIFRNVADRDSGVPVSDQQNVLAMKDIYPSAAGTATRTFANELTAVRRLADADFLNVQWTTNLSIAPWASGGSPMAFSLARLGD